VITEDKAREIARKAAKKLGLTEEEAWAKLKRVRRLQITPKAVEANEEPQPDILTLREHMKRRP